MSAPSHVNGTPVVFELVSAYGGVGLSLGVPYVSVSNKVSLVRP
jgi:Trk-type K+ transport system membrane component